MIFEMDEFWFSFWLYFIVECTLTLFRMGLFGAAHGWGAGGKKQKGPPP